MKKYLAELLGTYALVFAGTGAIVVNQELHGLITHVGIAATFGLVVMTMIYTFGRISGAHINPAVSLAFCIARKLPTLELFPYVISQFLGAFLASLTLRYLFPENQLLGCTLPAGNDMQSFMMECLLSFLLMLVILRVAHGSYEQGLFAGIVVGAMVGVEAMFAGPVSGASMNPARSLAPALVSGHMKHLWVYLTAVPIGMLAAVPIGTYLSSEK
jgi:aquaporin NIP